MYNVQIHITINCISWIYLLRWHRTVAICLTTAIPISIDLLHITFSYNLYNFIYDIVIMEYVRVRSFTLRWRVLVLFDIIFMH